MVFIFRFEFSVFDWKKIIEWKDCINIAFEYFTRSGNRFIQNLFAFRCLEHLNSFPEESLRFVLLVSWPRLKQFTQ